MPVTVRLRWGLAVAAILAVACSGSPEPAGPGEERSGAVSGSSPPEVSRRFVRVACALPDSQVLRTWRGYRPDRSGEIQIIADPPNYYNNHSHSGPWEYLQRVPMVFYGPGRVPAGRRVERPVTTPDVAPTLARLLRYEFDAPDGRAMDEVVDPDRDPPRLIVTVVWDGVGRNVLAEHPDAWPTLREIASGGVWFENATVGTSPSVTPAVHTALSSGAWPRHHGTVDLLMREGEKLFPIRRFPGDGVLVPTVGELYDRDRGNRPRVGMVGNDLTVGMLGRGATVKGGDRDILAITQKDRWVLPDRYVPGFRLPEYLNEVEGLEEALREVDQADGVIDGRWRDEVELTPEEAENTPAYPPYQTRVLDELIRRDGFGADDVPDLLFVNYKQADKVGHRWSMNSAHMDEVLRATDDALGGLVEALDRHVGEGEWVLALTADHGSTPDASVSGGYATSTAELEADLQERFDTDDDGRPVVEAVRVTQIWVDEEELAEEGHGVEDVADFLLDYTIGDNAEDAQTMPPERREERIFNAVFPGALLDGGPPCGLEE